MQMVWYFRHQAICFYYRENIILTTQIYHIQQNNIIKLRVYFIRSRAVQSIHKTLWGFWQLFPKVMVLYNSYHNMSIKVAIIWMVINHNQIIS